MSVKCVRKASSQLVIFGDTCTLTQKNGHMSVKYVRKVSGRFETFKITRHVVTQMNGHISVKYVRKISRRFETFEGTRNVILKSAMSVNGVAGNLNTTMPFKDTLIHTADKPWTREKC